MNKIEPEGMILLLGVFGFIVLTLAALIPDDLESGEYSFRASQGGGAVNALPQSGIAPVGGVQTAEPMAQNVVMQPLQSRRVYAYSGTIQKVLNRDPNGWGQIHVFVGDMTVPPQEISLSPQWYLQFQGCTPVVGQHVEGQAFLFSQPGAAHASNDLLYAKNVILNGVRCRLRTDNGLALWSDQLK
ncbi:MAG: hypothetical protein HQL48_02185 [Gammaproteobacteria bacterium]|nr:hypothetical protein [Gammaproteobacteria bacterium]